MDDFQIQTRPILMKNGQILPCRTCMGITQESRNLFNVEYKHLLDLLNCLLGFEARIVNDEYIICSTCEVLLKQLEEFKKTCLKSYEKFCSIECKQEDELGVDKDIRTYLETALSSENEDIDDQAVPVKDNDSDSDLSTKETRSNERPTRKTVKVSPVKKPARKCKKPFVYQQFSAKEVFQTIQECSNYISDLKYRTCISCDFQGSDNKSLALHMKYIHADFFKSWCYRCNLLEYDLTTHKQTLKCCSFICKLCGKDFKKHSRLIEHLKFHCNQTFDEAESQKLANLQEDLLNLEEIGSDNGRGLVKEEIITLSGATADQDLERNKHDGEKRLQKEEPPLSDPNDSDSKPLILRINQTRRFTKRSTRCIKRPNRYKNSVPNEDAGDNLRKIKKESQGNVENEELVDDPDPDYAESNVNNGATRGRIKCRLKQFDHEEVLQAINDTIKPFKMNRECIVCSFVASHSRALSVHMTLLHKDVKDSWCSRCNGLVNNLTEHSDGHRNDLLKCTFCGRSFNKFFHLKEHLKSHSRLHSYNTEPKWFSCKVCPNSYPDEQKLKEHECRGPDPSFTSKRKKKIKDSRFCVPCNKRVRSLPIHMKHKHNNDGELKEPSNKLCSVCGKSFSDNSKLTVHMRIHTGECPYKCSYCDKRCSTRNHLVVHERTHTGEKPHICYICGKAFAQSSVLGTHMKIHTGRPEQCSVCDQRFCRPAELKLHMRRHTGEKPYLCNNCGLSFHQRSHLVEHVKRHSNERPYKCSFCEKGFKQISVLKAHENIHTGLKPYKCTQCPYSCRQSYSLTVHMKQHSTDVPLPERPHKCLICCKHFSTHSMLMSHASNMHAEIVDNEKEFNRIETVMDCS